MKKLLCALLMMASLAHAEEVFIANNDKGADKELNITLDS